MTIADRRGREKDMRRNSIIDAAEKLFFSKGIPDTTMDDVATMAELSKGTIYLYFKNKEELYIAIVRRGLTIIRDMFEAAVASAPTGIEKVRAMGRAMFSFYQNHPNYFIALFHHENAPVDLCCDNPMTAGLLKEGSALFDQCIGAIKSGIGDGTIRPDIDPVMISMTLYGLILGVIRMVAVEEKHMLKECNISSTTLVAYVFDIVGGFLANPRQARTS